MIYDTSNEIELNQCNVRYNYLCKNGRTIELIEKRKIRTTPQNSYLHLLLTWYAIETGNTLRDVKIDVYKKLVNPEIYVYERVDIATGEIIKDLRSSADLDTKEMTISIDRFRNYSASVGYYLPEANETKFLDHIRNEEKRHKVYL